MYSDIKSIHIIISLLKQNNIKNIVISPGTGNWPLVHSLQYDNYFSCYSIVDERSAAYFALGLSESLNEPVCLSCTTSTATCNYLPAIKEASERNIQLIAITVDKDRKYLFQMSRQHIYQYDMFSPFTRGFTELPFIKTDDEYNTAVRGVNEVLLSLNHNEKGPVQINFMRQGHGKFSCNKIQECRKINRIKNNKSIEELKETLKKFKKIIVLCGSHNDENFILTEALIDFKETYDAVICCDHFSGIYAPDFVLESSIPKTVLLSDYSDCIPDLIITIGSLVRLSLSDELKEYKMNYDHWHISSFGELNDGFQKLNIIIESVPSYFFELVTRESEKRGKCFNNAWRKLIGNIKIPVFEFSNYYIIQQFTKIIPTNSILHLSILDSIRMTNTFVLPQSVKCYANTGCDGIDGCLSTFIGQALNTDELAFLIIGDLSFLYDLNAVCDDLPNNIRILLINNYAGAEFHYNFYGVNPDVLNKYTAAGHNTNINSNLAMEKFLCLNARNKKELEDAFEVFVKENKKPILLEAFTNAVTDAESRRIYEDLNLSKKSTVRKNIRALLRKLGMERIVERLYKAVRK